MVQDTTNAAPQKEELKKNNNTVHMPPTITTVMITTQASHTTLGMKVTVTTTATMNTPERATTPAPISMTINMATADTETTRSIMEVATQPTKATIVEITMTAHTMLTTTHTVKRRNSAHTAKIVEPEYDETVLDKSNKYG